MAGQEKKNKHEGAEPDAPDTDAPAPAGAAKNVNDDELDALLDDIDEALESNAETFVRGFQQKGGQ